MNKELLKSSTYEDWHREVNIILSKMKDNLMADTGDWYNYIINVFQFDTVKKAKRKQDYQQHS